MNKQRLFATLRGTAAVALSIAGLMALSACEEHPYPARHSAPPPAPPPAELMGAPDQGSAYAAPPVYQQPAYAPPPYDAGSVVAMAPIPNPGDPGSGPYYDGRHYGGRRVHARYEAGVPEQMAENTVTSPYDEGHPAPGRHPSYTYPATAPTPASPVYTPPETTTDTAKIEHKGAAVAVAVGAAAGLLAQDTKHAAVQAKQAATTASAGKTNPAVVTPTPATALTGDQATNLSNLQTALTDAVGKSAILRTPARFTAGQPADVSLTLPAGFGDTLKSDAQKDGLGDAAASVNMTALLSGAGFAVTPDDTQSATLATGQPTEFHWTVTAQPGAKGPLHADVGADLLGGGSEKLALGSVAKSAARDNGAAPRVMGVALLVLIGVLLVAWVNRRPRQPTVRRETVIQSGRPLDMAGPSDT